MTKRNFKTLHNLKDIIECDICGEDITNNTGFFIGKKGEYICGECEDKNRKKGIITSNISDIRVNINGEFQ